VSTTDNEPLHSGDERLVIVSQWLRKADNDLRTAEHTLTLVEDCPFDTIGFHAQQCTEKALKAVLAAHGSDVPRTHDLRKLVDALRAIGHLPADVTGLDLDLVCKPCCALGCR